MGAKGDEGGNLQSVFGQKLGFTPAQLTQPPHSTYLVHRGYDEYGQVTREIAGNLSTTTRTFQPKTHRLASVERTFKDDAHRQDATPSYINQQIYNYNGAGDVVHTINYPNLAAPGAAVQPVRTEVNYFYDNLHQLTSTVGQAIASDTQKYHYLVDQQYDEIGSIKLKDQSSFSATATNGNWAETPIASQTYRNTYTYGGTQPHAPSRIATQAGPTVDYQYDASGNHKQRTSTLGTRDATWTDDDQLRSLKRATDQYDQVRNYYGASGEKALTWRPQAEALPENSPPPGAEEVAYLGGDLTIRVNADGAYVTKHIFAGGERIASKMDAGWFTSAPIQYYATDHLGSAQYTLDGHQNLISHTEYFPSGELWLDQLNSAYNLPPRYSFTGKEWDADTGLYDFGARQYDPRVGQWLSPDPALHEFMLGMHNGGVYVPGHLNAYGYVLNNPIRYRDQNGKWETIVWIEAFKTGLLTQGELASLGPWAGLVIASSVALKVVVDEVGPQVFDYVDMQADKEAIARFEAEKGKVPTEESVTDGVPGTESGGAGKKPPGGPTPPTDGAEEPVRRFSSPKHHANSESPEPKNVQELFDKSTVDQKGVRWAKDSGGTIHRFSKPSNGESHWNGSTAGKDPIKPQNIPTEIKKALGE